MGLAGWAKSRWSPSPAAPSFRKKIDNNFSVTVVESFNRFWAVNCSTMRLAAGLHPDPLGSYSAPPDFLAVIKGGGREWEGKGWKLGWKRRGKDVKG